MADIGWARSRGDRAEGEGLRRGAWYRVVENPPKDYVVLDVHRNPPEEGDFPFGKFVLAAVEDDLLYEVRVSFEAGEEVNEDQQ